MKTYHLTSRGVDYTLEATDKAGSQEWVLVTIPGIDWATELFSEGFWVTMPDLSGLNTTIDARIAGEIARRAQVVCVRKADSKGHYWVSQVSAFKVLMLTVVSNELHTQATGLSEITELLETLEK